MTHDEALAKATGFVFGAGQRPVVLAGEVAFILLSQKLVATIDAEDAAAVSDYTWSAMQPQNVIYAATRMPNNTNITRLHRFLLRNSTARAVDHKDMDGLNCRRYNLREATIAENCCNVGMNPKNTSGYRGVFWRPDRRKWQAQIRVSRKRICLGTYDTAEQAGEAYVAAAKKYHGEFTRVG